MLSREQDFYDDMERIVDPYTYDGNRFGTCLIGQMVTELGLSTIEDLARAYAIESDDIYSIYHTVAEDQYNDNLNESLEYVRQFLGLA